MNKCPEHRTKSKTHHHQVAQQEQSTEGPRALLPRWRKRRSQDKVQPIRFKTPAVKDKSAPDNLVDDFIQAVVIEMSALMKKVSSKREETWSFLKGENSWGRWSLVSSLRICAQPFPRMHHHHLGEQGSDEV